MEKTEENRIYIVMAIDTFGDEDFVEFITKSKKLAKKMRNEFAKDDEKNDYNYRVMGTYLDKKIVI